MIIEISEDHKNQNFRSERSEFSSSIMSVRVI